MIRKFFRKYKIKAKKLLTVIILTALEMVALLWYNNWQFSPVLIIPLIQFALIFEKKNMWSKLSDEEKEKVLLSEDDVSGLIRGVSILIKKGKSTEDIIEKIKKN